MARYPVPGQGRRAAAVTSRVMAANRAKNSRVELSLRRELHARGVRFRLHARDLPGRPDIVIRKYRLAIFVDGDFWHGNAWRRRGLQKLEDDFNVNREYWVAKIRRNMERDREVTQQLQDDGWTVIRLWESSLRHDLTGAADIVEEALRERKTTLRNLTTSMVGREKRGRPPILRG
jgi:DNA mismatch endonuclease, patch repair protein